MATRSSASPSPSTSPRHMEFGNAVPVHGKRRWSTRLMDRMTAAAYPEDRVLRLCTVPLGFGACTRTTGIIVVYPSHSDSVRVLVLDLPV